MMFRFFRLHCRTEGKKRESTIFHAQMRQEQAFTLVSGQTRTRMAAGPKPGSSGTDRVQAAIGDERGRFFGLRDYGILPLSLQETQRSGIMEKIPREFLAMHGLLYTYFI